MGPVSALWWFVPAGALSAVPFFRAGLPRVRLLVGWIGAVVFAVEGAVGVYYLGLLAAFVFQDVVDRADALAIPVWALGSLGAAICLGFLMVAQWRAMRGALGRSG